ncbi:putative ribonuclease H-like domain-containing protein [Tanacetum coccineum]
MSLSDRNVKGAFLYAKLDEEVYVSQHPGFVDPKYPKKVYKVVKALYGLHQAPRAWYTTLSTFLLKSGYRRGTIDKTLFIKKDKNDIMLMSSMGEFTFFLGLQVKQKEDGSFISQDKYVAEILRVDFDLSMIGSLMYLTASRFDIMFAVCACSRFQSIIPILTYEPNSVVTMLEQILTGNPQQEVVNFLAGDLFHGNAKSRQLWLLLLQRQNMLLLQIAVDFLTRSSIHYALTVSPVVSTTFVEQFWMSAKSKIINNVRYITAKVAGKPVNILEASIRSDLLFDNADGIDSLHN